MKFLLAALVLALGTGGALAQDAAKAKRLALVIGNGAYKDVALPNPLHDAEDMEKALKASGFTVIKRTNASLKEMHLALREFGDRLDRQGTGLFYFAGHGLQVKGRNYLMPVDADIAREDEVAFQAMDLGAVMDKLDSAKNPVNIVIIDACRDNPFGKRLAPSAKGLAPIDAPPGTFIAYATAPGSTAADGKGRNGLYTAHLVKQIEKPGVSIEEVFKAVRAGVRTDSKNLQVPWESTSLESNFAFRAAPPKPAPAPAPVKTVAASPSAPRSIAAAPNSPPAFVAGDTWVYRITNLADGSAREAKVSVKDVRGDEVHWSNGNVSDLFGNNIRMERSRSVETFTPASTWFAFPMRPGNVSDVKFVQTITESDGRKRVMDSQVKITVIGEEEIEVPAGKMRAVKVERVANWKQRDSENGGVRTQIYWYNGAVKRIVMLEDKNVTLKGKTVLHERHALTSQTTQ
jgi:uncharacterized caspase-like protein